MCEIVHCGPSGPRCENLPVRAPFFFIAESVPGRPASRPSFPRGVEDAGVERFVIMAMAQPVRMLVQDVRSAFQRGAESLRDFLDGRETEFFDEYLGCDSVFRPEIRFDFGKLAVSEMASHGVSHFMQFGKTNSS